MKPNQTEMRLWAYAQGGLAADERGKMEKALVADPVLRRELTMISAYVDALPAEEPSQAEWDALETRVLAGWRAMQAGPEPEPSPAWRFRPAWGAVMLAVAVAAAFVVWLGGENAPPPQALKLPAEVAFSIGEPTATGLVAPLAVAEKAGDPYIAVHSLSRGYAQGGDEIATGDNQAVKLLFRKRITISLLPRTTLRFHELDGAVAPYLVRGAVVIETQPGDGEPFRLVAEGLKITDIGTRFSVTTDGKGEGTVAVVEGAVRVERPGVATAQVGAGKTGRWSPGRTPTRIERRTADVEPFASVERFFPSTPRDDGDGEEPAAKSARAPKVAPVNPAVGVVPPESQSSAKTSWQRTLESLSAPEVEAINRFYAEVERQMTSGYTVHAIENLENYIGDHRGAESEKARFLLAECHYNLQERSEALVAYQIYLGLYEDGAWRELAKARLAELMRQLGLEGR
ncbi:MAG: hypothetical protein C4523_15315 [Myxococcales bacterium]|nr:MAG: hypothetical protein C4523_15315 [Myxococcales bacterium]